MKINKNDNKNKIYLTKTLHFEDILFLSILFIYSFLKDLKFSNLNLYFLHSEILSSNDFFLSFSSSFSKVFVKNCKLGSFSISSMNDFSPFKTLFVFFNSSSYFFLA